MRRIGKLLGATLLAALAAGCGGSHPRSIVLPPLSAVTLNVSADTLAVDGTAQFTATALDLSSQPVSGAPFTWSSTDASVLTVNSTGLVTARGEGSAHLVVESEGMRDSAAILVLPATAGWFAQTSNSSRQLNGVFFEHDGRTGCVVGNAGEILTTSDAGATWVRRTSGTIFNLNAVWFVSATDGWAVGGNGTALRTADAGATWSPVTTGSSDNLASVYFASPDTGWVVGSNGVVLTTFDPNTATPFLKQYPASVGLNGVFFAGTRDGWAVGNNGTILGSHDRGLTWFTVQPSVTGSTLRKVWRVDEPTAIAVGASGAVGLTIPGATPSDTTSWTLGSAGAGNNLEGVSFVSTLRGWAVGANGGGVVLATTNGGSGWTPQTAPAGNTLRNVFFVDALRGWAVGDNGRILHTGTGGE
jgi:photosystem II stability/assembly factor-like uncharacterized protein